MMIFIFEKDDVYAERKLHMFKLNHTLTIKREGEEGSKKARFYLVDHVGGPALTDKMKRGKLARYLNANGYCPLEQRHIANHAAPYLDKVANAAIDGYKSAPKILWQGKPDGRTLHSLLPPNGINCRCTMAPIIVDPKKVATAKELDESNQTSVFYGDTTIREEVRFAGLVPRGTDEQAVAELDKILACENPTQEDAPEDATHWYGGSIRHRACWLRLNTKVQPVQCDYWCQGHWLVTRFSMLMTTRIQPVAELPKNHEL